MQILDHVRLVASGKLGFDWTHASDCNVYLIGSGDEFALIDSGTGQSVEHILKEIKAAGCSVGCLKYIILTHLHADHAGGACRLRESTGAELVVWSESKRILEEGDETAIDLDRAREAGFYPKDYRFEPCKADVPIQDGDVLKVGELKVRTLLTPGHSRLDTSFLVERKDGHVSLFAGDTVFAGGRISLLHTHDFDQHALARSMKRLNDESFESLFPGHLQPAIRNGKDHVAEAVNCFNQLKVPQNIL